ncbi:MAG TPA: hypothetical protein EYP98_16020 [Planctomycetes bacterium]|nr:hypothetical protein [Planctomycetota bacterium]
MKLAPFLAVLAFSTCSPLPISDGNRHATEQVAEARPVRLNEASQSNLRPEINRPTKAPSSRQVASMVSLLYGQLKTLGATDEPKQVLVQIDQLEKDLSRIRAAAWEAVNRGELLHVEAASDRGAAAPIANFTQVLLRSF